MTHREKVVYQEEVEAKLEDKLFWFQKGYEMNVTNYCEASFHIGEYKDEILCGVILMDTY
jgi:hypothetical protein